MKLFKKNKNLRVPLPSIFIIIAIAIIGLVIIAPFRFSKADPEISSADITATLYDSEAYTTGTELTTSGSTVGNWKYSTNKYLWVDPSVPNDGNTYKIIVELPQEFYGAISSVTVPSGYSDVSFTKNNSFTVNGNQTYPLNAYSGIFEYTMEKDKTNATFQLAISYDIDIWSKQANSRLTPEGVKPIVVKLKKVDTNGNETIEKEISISEAYASSDTISIGNSFYVDGINSNTLSPYKVTDSFETWPSMTNASNGRYYSYFKNLTVTYVLPSYTDSDNIKHYISPDLSSLRENNLKTSLATINTSELSNGILKFSVQNPYVLGGTLYRIKMNFPNTLVPEPNKNYKFTNGSLRIIGDTKNGQTDVVYYNHSFTPITYTTILEENVKLSTVNSSVSIYNRPDGLVSRLGGIQLRNDGQGDSEEKSVYIQFDINNSNKVFVTTINLPCDTVQQEIPIEYTLVDENGNRVFLDSSGNRVDEMSDGAVGTWTYNLTNSHYNSSSQTGAYTRIRRDMLALPHRQYYFKTIKYPISTIQAGIKLYSGSTYSVTYSGNIWGYISQDATTSDVATHKITVTSQSQAVNEISSSANTTFTNNSTNAYYLSGSMNKSSIVAGESVTLNGSITITSYPYGTSTWLNDTIVGIILPNGVTINRNSITASKTGEGTFDGIELDLPQDLGNGKSLWRIRFPSEKYIGLYDEALSTLAANAQFTYSMQLDTDSSMNTALLEAKDMIIVAGLNQTNAGNGSYAYTRVVDTYDLNENGATNDYIVRVINSNTNKCQIIPQPATLDVKDSITIRSNGNLLEQGNSIYSNTDIVTYTVNIGCSSGGRLDEFEYYIPIIKKTSAKDNFINRTDSGFDFNLIGGASLEGDDIFNIQYCFDTGLTYQTAKQVSNWYSSTDIENDINLRFEDVTMIKITMKNGVINNGEAGKISINMKYGGDNYVSEVGLTNKWSSGGIYNYYNNGRIVSGDTATDGVEIKINCLINMIDEAITLTAAKDRLPELAGNVNVITVNNGLPAMKNVHNFTITNIETYNVNLVTKDYMNQNIDMSSTLANQTFGITVKVNNGTEYDSISGTSVGASNADTVPEFTYELYNANALTDNLQTRYVIITLSSDMGLVIKQKININIETVEISEVNPSIVAGKNYTATVDTNSSITITKDSAFSAQFSSTYIPSLYSSQKILFSDALPENTCIVLVDMRENQNPTYWYYRATNSNVTEVDFTSFDGMGTTSQNKFTKLSDSNIVTEQFIIVVDFARCTSYMENKEHTIQLEYEGQETEDFNSMSLNFTTTNKRDFALNISQESTNFNTNFEVNYNIENVTGIDTRYLGRKLSLVINAPSNLPQDSWIQIGTNKYYMNSDRKFIISLADIQSTTATITMQMCSKMLPKVQANYNFTFELWASATANGIQPLFGDKLDEKNLTISNVEIPQPALKVISIDDRLIKLSEVQNSNNVIFNYKKIEGCTVTIELQKKIGNGYQKVTNVLSQVNGVTTHNMGVYSLNPANGSNTIIPVLSITTEKGTYRYVFRVKDENGNDLIEVPYNFMIIDD